MYGVIVRSREVTVDGSVITPAGTEFWVAPYGATRCSSIPGDRFSDRTIRVFETAVDAIEFLRGWIPPWRCKPDGEPEIVRLAPIRETVVVGFRRADESKRVRKGRSW